MNDKNNKGTGQGTSQDNKEGFKSNEVQPTCAGDLPTTLWALIAYLLDDSKWAKLLLVLGLLFILFRTIIVIFQIENISIEPDGVIRIDRFLSPTAYAMMVHPRGWQDTGITVTPGERFKVSVSGQVNIGIDCATIAENGLKIDEYFYNTRSLRGVGFVTEKALEDYGDRIAEEAERRRRCNSVERWDPQDILRRLRIRFYLKRLLVGDIGENTFDEARDPVALAKKVRYYLFPSVNDTKMVKQSSDRTLKEILTIIEPETNLHCLGRQVQQMTTQGDAVSQAIPDSEALIEVVLTDAMLPKEACKEREILTVFLNNYLKLDSFFAQSLSYDLIIERLREISQKSTFFECRNHTYNACAVDYLAQLRLEIALSATDIATRRFFTDLLELSRLSEDEARVVVKHVETDQEYPIGWPWSGPRGIRTDWMETHNKIPSNHKDDNTLMAPKFPHGRLIGYLALPSDNDFRGTFDSPGGVICAGAKTNPDLILDLAMESSEIQIPTRPDIRGASLFVAVNDSTIDSFQNDNLGMFFVHFSGQHRIAKMMEGISRWIHK